MPEIPLQRTGVFWKGTERYPVLDEIGDIPLSYQEVLLRVLQERSVTNLGSNTPVDIKSVRIIAATNKDLVKEVEEGHFCEDLFYRLSLCQLRLPQLSEIIEKEPDWFKDIQGNILVKIKQNGDSQLNDLCLDGNALRFIKNYE